MKPSRPRSLAMSVLLCAALSLLKVCCFTGTPASRTCCANKASSEIPATPRPLNEHSAPCCSGSAYLTKEEVPSSTPAFPTAQTLPAPLHVAQISWGELLPSKVTSYPNRAVSFLVILLRTVSAANAPPEPLCITRIFNQNHSISI
jgi:hypothetical protein